MKKSKRKIIGRILVWGGLGISVLTSGIFLLGNTSLSGTTVAWVDIVSNTAILIGGLWGMRN